MGKKVLLVCDEVGCAGNAIDKAAELSGRGEISELYCLKVIPHPPLQWCEHGGADSEKAEHALDEANRRRREAWTAHEEGLHGEEVGGVVSALKAKGIGAVKVKFLEKEIGFGSSLLNEIRDNGYDTVIMTEKSWDQVQGKKVPPGTKIITVSGPVC